MKVAVKVAPEPPPLEASCASPPAAVLAQAWKAGLASVTVAIGPVALPRAIVATVTVAPPVRVRVLPTA